MCPAPAQVPVFGLTRRQTQASALALLVMLTMFLDHASNLAFASGEDKRAKEVKNTFESKKNFKIK
jgi:hypothetical protein